MNAATKTSAGTGNWSTGATWVGGVAPLATDDVVIAAGHTITLTANATCVNLTIGNGATASVLNNAGFTLNVDGTVTMFQPTGSVTNAWNINAGIATVTGLITFSGANITTTRRATIVLTTGTLNANGGITFTASDALTKVINMSGGAGTLNLKGALTVPALSSTLTAGTTSFFNYCDNLPQTINYFSGGAYGNLNLNNTDPTLGVTLGAAITTANVSRNINVQSGLFRTNNLAIGMVNAMTLTVTAGATMNAGTSVISPGTGATITINGLFQTANTVGFSGSVTAAINSTNTPTITLGANSTIEYNNAVAVQTVSNITYSGNLILTGLSKTITAGTVTVAKNFTINSGATYNGAANPVLNIGGDFSNSGTFTSGTGLVTFNGTVTQTILGSSATIFSNGVTINNTSGTSGLNITTSPTINGLLTFTSGKITTGGNKVTLGSAATTAGSGAGKYIYGNEEILIPNALAPSKTFIIGDATTYNPVTITFVGTTSGSGSLIASTTAGDDADVANSGINPTLSVNRNWTINQGTTPVGGFTSYDGTFTFDAGDIDVGANTANFVIRKYAASAWSTTTISTKTAFSTKATGMTTFGKYQIGEAAAITIATNPPGTLGCPGPGASISSTSSSLPAPTVIWQRDPNTGTFTDITAGMDGSIYTNYTTTTLTISTIIPNYKYRAVFTNINGSATSTACATTTVLPAAAGSISGSATVCTFQTGVAFSVPAITGATSYVWSYTGSGFSIATGTGTNSITADFNALATTGSLTVYAVNGCGNGTVSPAFSVTVNISVGSASTIYGTDWPCQGQSYSFYIPIISGATSYVWTYTGTGMTFSGPASTITGTFSAAATAGNLTVSGVNGCGAGPSSPVMVVTPSACLPHNSCSNCHMLHSSVGGALTAVNGNPNLCISCHNPVGIASTKPLSNADKAIPGVSGNSHSWSKPSVNATYQTNLTTDPDMVTRLAGDSIICSTCHDQHNPNTYGTFLRISNSEGGLCVNCHTARDVKRYADNPANKGTHPVGVAYNASDPRFFATTLPLSPTSKVTCSTCHKAHYATSTNGTILRVSSSDAICIGCHTYASATGTLNHKNMSCTTCHYSHSNGSNNIYLVNGIINTPSSGLKTAVFTTDVSGSNFADGTGTYNGVCEVCHTTTDHYTNTSMGTIDARHIVSPVTKCVTCHPHNTGFSAQTDCMACHNAIADKPLVGPAGGRRQIVDASGDGLGAGGDFKRTSHHVTGAIPNVADCIKCHFMGDHKLGQVKLLDPDLGYLNIITYDPLNKKSIERFCIKCHDQDGSNGDLTPFSDGVNVPLVDSVKWLASAHKGNVNTETCLSCHDNGHGSNKSTMLEPSTYAGPGTGTDVMNEEEGFCLKCHGAAGLATIKVHLAFSGTNTLTNFFKHDPNNTYRKHKPGESAGADFAGANRHIECVDCHNPHGAVAGTAAAPALLPTMIGAKGVEPIYGVSNTSPGAPTGFTWQNSVTQEYQVCFKCHSSYTTLPSYTPGGILNQVVTNTGLKKITTVANNQVADSRDMASEYNPNNNSYHPVMAIGKNPGINASGFQAGYSSGSRIYCSSCHNSNNSATAGNGRGPHGSDNLHILDKGFAGNAQYNTMHGSAGNNANSLCSKCHTAPSDASGAAAPTRFYKHAYHTSPTGTAQAECYVCHDSHGSEQFHMMNFNNNESCFTTPWPNTSQSAFNHAAGVATNSCVVVCHGKSHNAGSKTYTPNY
ncbi:MAG: hypothetical protein NTX97_00405 [Bacteroidetes bacterium]|nr:hypothetical protein [Bacteroidota bacterium]